MAVTVYEKSTPRHKRPLASDSRLASGFLRSGGKQISKGAVCRCHISDYVYRDFAGVHLLQTDIIRHYLSLYYNPLSLIKANSVARPVVRFVGRKMNFIACSHAP